MLRKRIHGSIYATYIEVVCCEHGRTPYFAGMIAPCRAASARVEGIKIAIARTNIHEVGSNNWCCQYLRSCGEPPDKFAFQGINAYDGAAIISDIETPVGKRHTATDTIYHALTQTGIERVRPEFYPGCAV